MCQRPRPRGGKPQEARRSIWGSQKYSRQHDKQHMSANPDVTFKALGDNRSCMRLKGSFEGNHALHLSIMFVRADLLSKVMSMFPWSRVDIQEIVCERGRGGDAPPCLYDAVITVRIPFLTTYKVEFGYMQEQSTTEVSFTLLSKDSLESLRTVRPPRRLEAGDAASSSDRNQWPELASIHSGTLSIRPTRRSDEVGETTDIEFEVAYTPRLLLPSLLYSFVDQMMARVIGAIEVVLYDCASQDAQVYAGICRREADEAYMRELLATARRLDPTHKVLTNARHCLWSEPRSDPREAVMRPVVVQRCYQARGKADDMLL